MRSPSDIQRSPSFVSSHIWNMICKNKVFFNQILKPELNLKFTKIQISFPKHALTLEAPGCITAHTQSV